MGRYYTGDIEGKFWFAVQSSTAADRFKEHYTPDHVCYYFDENDLQELNEELNNIKETIGEENLKNLNDFFEKVNSYSNKMLEEHGIDEIWEEHKSNYADYTLGLKIQKCLKENGSCQFEAEL